MGQAIVLALAKSWEFAALAEYLATGDFSHSSTFTYQQNYLKISTSERGWVQTENMLIDQPDHDDDYRAEYESDDYLCEEFRRDVASLRFFTFRFNDIALMRNVLRWIMRCVVDRKELGWFDTDYGWVVSAEDFLRNTDQDPDWDWRIPADSLTDT